MSLSAFVREKRSSLERLVRAAFAWTPQSIALFLAAALLCAACADKRRAEPTQEGAETLSRKIEQTQDGDRSKASAKQARPTLEPTNRSPKTLLRETLAAYANAKYYSDSGYVEFVCEETETRRLRSYRVPCSTTLAKPNYFRVQLGSSLLRSDGKTLRAQILERAYEGQALERPAPLVVASIREFYPDAQFAEAANLGIPPNLFWTSPQLALLFAKDPKKTLIPDDAELKILEPEYLRFNDGDPNARAIPCDRLQIAAEDGVRVLWIDREKKTLARCELPLEQTVSPSDSVKVVLMRVDFPDQEISDSAPQALERFALEDADAELVDRFLPPELVPLNKRFPKEALIPTRADENDFIADEKPRFALLYFRSPDVGDSNNFAACRAFAEAEAYYGAYEEQLDLLAVDRGVNTDGGEAIDSNVAEFRAPIYRLDLEKAAKADPAFAKIDAPSFMLVDKNGLVVKYLRDGFSLTTLRRLIARALEGGDLTADDFNAYYDGVRRFSDFAERSDLQDLYRFSADLNVPIAVPNRQAPKTFDLIERWRFSNLRSPMNPLPVCADDLIENGVNENDAEKNDAGELGENKNAASALPEELLVVPSDGNALTLLSVDGQLIRKTAPAAAAGEPIGFVRTARMANGKRFYAASAQNQARKIHRFDENFNDLGSLDVGRAQDQRVGDALFADVNGDGVPELILSLLGGDKSSVSHRNGVYAVDMNEQKILWKYESILEPSRLAFCESIQDPGGASGQNDATNCRGEILAMDYVEGTTGAPVRLDLATGERVGVFRSPENESIRRFASVRPSTSSAAAIGAIVTSPESTRASFIGLTRGGVKLWENAAPAFPDSAMERLSTADINGDGQDEWIVASPDGTILFFDASGKKLDQFQYGAEITGARIAKWKNGTFLIVADLNGVSAWQFERRRRLEPRENDVSSSLPTTGDRRSE